MSVLNEYILNLFIYRARTIRAEKIQPNQLIKLHAQVFAAQAKSERGKHHLYGAGRLIILILICD